jgi:putative N-acetyltransferase (TIGR04045 family)
VFEVLTGERPGRGPGRGPAAAPPPYLIEPADGPALAAYRQLRTRVFVAEQGLFDRSDGDDRDEDPRTVVLVARAPDGTVIGGVRLGPAGPGPDIGWWQGGRLVVDPAARRSSTGADLVRAACAHAEQAGALRFDATVQPAQEGFFRRLGWRAIRAAEVAGHPHVLMRWPIGRLAALAATAKSPLGGLLAGLGGIEADGTGLAPGGDGFRGDDGAPVPGTDLVAACDAIVPSMVERDPHWAGWCSVLVNVNDLAAMGARPAGLLDAVGARDASFAARILAGLGQAAAAYDVPVLGGHTQLGVPAALSVTALGRTADPVPGGGGRPGHRVRITADLGGDWRRGYRGRQWDSTTARRTPDLRAMLTSVAAARPAAAKDVSMAGLAGTLGMLAEASGCRAVLDVARVPRPAAATAGDWLSCFPGFAMITTADRADDRPLPAGPAATAACGELTTGRGVALRWPDGECTEVIAGAVTGLGTA